MHEIILMQIMPADDQDPKLQFLEEKTSSIPVYCKLVQHYGGLTLSAPLSHFCEGRTCVLPSGTRSHFCDES